MPRQWLPGMMHRCEECLRPVCQRQLDRGRFDGEVEGALINDYGMYGDGGNA